MGKGRNKELIHLRNMNLLRRYHQLTEVERLRFDDTIRKLSEEEFFISEITIIEIIQRFYNKADFEENNENK